MTISKANLIAFTILGVLATAFAPLMGGDLRNYLVIAVLFLTPVLILTFRWPLWDTLWLAAVLLYMMIVTVLTSALEDLSTVFYTLLFILSYLCFVSYLQTGRIERKSILRFLRILIFAFGIVSVIQMAASLAGLPVPNRLASKGMWSYNSLAVEPSHLGRVLSISMLAYLVLVRENADAALSPARLLWRERKVVAAFLLSILLSGSSLAILSAPLALLFAFPKRWILVFSGAMVVIWPFVFLLDLPALQRGLIFLTALPSMDARELAAMDHSAFVRVAPVLVYFSKMDFSSAEFWFGGGVSAIRPFLWGEISGVAESKLGAGFFPGYPLAFGFIGTFLMLSAFLLRFLHPATLAPAALWLMLFPFSAWNSQLFWYGLMLLRVVHHYEVSGGRWRPFAFTFGSRRRPASAGGSPV